MISPHAPITSTDVARHYDELDELYRDTWGDHLHHGFWESPNDHATVHEATNRLLQQVTEPLQLSPGQRVADIGCGYGTSARWLAEKHGIEVLGLTLSQRQAQIAQELTKPTRGQIKIILEDWLHNTLPSHCLDAAYCIEALAHMEDKAAFFRQLQRTLKPGASAVISCWLIPEKLNPLEKALLRTICREGQLPHLGTMNDYCSLAQSHGLQVLTEEDFTDQVAPTWTHITRRVFSGFFSKPKYTRFILRRLLRQRLFLFTLPRLLFAYRIGAIRYGLLHLQVPKAETKRAEEIPPLSSPFSKEGPNG